MNQAIYRITNTSTQKVYIGSAVDYKKRWRDHKFDLRNQRHCNKKLQNSWNKHGAEVFLFEVIELVAEKDNLLIREQFWIDFYDSFREGYNMTPRAGSPLGRKQTVETKEKLREINSTPEAIAAHRARHAGKIVSEETRKKQALAKLGKRRSEESRAKQSESIKRYWSKRNADKHKSEGC